MTGERKLVTVLFADVVGSTALGSENEPEVVRDVMARYFERMKTLAETYGGTVEKFIGDAVMVVFGVPRLHDDDAERAVRCALAMQEAMAGLNHELGMSLAIRVGVNSGRTVTGATEGVLVTGDTVNIAARLQQGAEPGEIIVGSLTEELTRPAIEYQPHTPISAKGKVEPITAFRVLRPHSAVPREARGLGALQAPFVGREHELGLLLDTFDRVKNERRAHLLTVLGVAGVGKSRLVREALGRMAEESWVRVLQGRCLPYGKGITYWPVLEILQQDTGIALEDDRDTALDKLERRLAEVVPATPQRRTIRNRLAVVLGLELPANAMADVPAAQVDLELGWAVRQHLQALAAQQPLVTVIDDLQWAEPAVIRLLELTALRVTAQPILLLCVARPELGETHPGWGAGPVNAASITINPLSPAETSTLISRLLEVDELPAQLRQRLVERSQGNPLFCEEFLRMLIDDMRLVRVDERWRAAEVATDVRVPESIHALLAARLDGLSLAQKRTLQAASVIGERFAVGQVRGLLPNSYVEDALEDLLLKGLVVEDEDAAESAQLRFKHLLIRDVAYETVPKNERADLHERFERHIQQQVGDREPEFIEILAHHAERAFSLSREIRLAGATLQRRADRALTWSLLRGDRALSREDTRALATSLTVARLAAEAGAFDDATQLRLKLLEAESLRLGARFAAALSASREAASMAAQQANQTAAAAAQLCAARTHLRSGDPVAMGKAASEAARLYRLAGDTAGEIEAEWTLVLSRLGNLAGWPAIEEAIKLADRAQKSGAAARAAQIRGWAAAFAAGAGLPEEAERLIGEAAALTDQLGLISQYRLDMARSFLARMRGNLEQAEAILLRLLGVLEDMGGVWESIGVRRFWAITLIKMGRYADAEAVLERALKDSEEAGERWNRAELLGWRATAAIHRQDLQAAQHYAELALESIAPGDIAAGIEVTYAVGQVRAAHGRFAEAETCFRHVLETMRQTGFFSEAPEIYVGIARFFAERGQMAEATPLLDTAQSWLERAGYTLWLDEISRIRQLANVSSPS